jgi:ABC-type nickel/cobalt efflux system permease component RcnA
VTWKTLLALGISGGIVPCPSALVVLLSAIALHRLAYGMLLISAFSLGLASVLVAIGLIVVCARGVFDRIPAGGPLLQRLPVASAAAITIIGVVLVVRALGLGV